MAEHVELDCGILTASTLHTQRGPIANTANIGQFRFFVSYIEADGGRWCLWDGADYDEAIVTAEQTCAAFGISEPVRDRVVRGAHD